MAEYITEREFEVLLHNVAKRSSLNLKTSEGKSILSSMDKGSPSAFPSRNKFDERKLKLENRLFCRAYATKACCD